MISPSDPQSAWTAKANKRVQFGYGLNYLIDIKNAIIVDVEATPARTYDEGSRSDLRLAVLCRSSRCDGMLALPGSADLTRTSDKRRS
jgi:hypothetical protein